MYSKYLVDYCKNDVDRQCEVLDWVFPLVDFDEDEAFLARHTLELFILPHFAIDFAHALKIRMGMEHQLQKVFIRHRLFVKRQKKLTLKCLFRKV